MGCVAPGLWAHPRDASWRYKDTDCCVELARLLERGKFDGLFLADVLGVYDVYQGSHDAALHQAAQVPVNNPLLVVPELQRRGLSLPRALLGIEILRMLAFRTTRNSHHRRALPTTA